MSAAAVWVGRYLDEREGGVYAAGPPCSLVSERIRRWQLHADRIVTSACRNPKLGLPKICVIEGYSYGSKGSVISLGELGGIIRERLLDAVRLVEVPPTALKRFVTGKGQATKELMIATLAREYEVVYNNSDEYDALALWLFGHAILCGTTFGFVSARQAKVAQDAVKPQSPKPKKRKGDQ